MAISFPHSKNLTTVKLNTINFRVLAALCFDECQFHVLKWYLQGYILEWGRIKCPHKAWHRKTCPPSLLWAQAFPPAAFWEDSLCFWIKITFHSILLRKQCCCTASFESAATLFCNYGARNISVQMKDAIPEEWRALSKWKPNYHLSYWLRSLCN